ncbi:hypothetical protein IKG33_03540, partial [Candidatus Saccharibacteria bacterium]|nr:hypothetical protein [Candidatus Saccharibacteria bacterium]
TEVSVLCNDPNGYSIYAIGYSNDTYGTTTLIGSNTNTTIATGTATSGSTSNWAMKVGTSGTNAPVIDNSFSSFKAVPSTYTRVAHKTGTTGSTASSFTTTYAAFISGTQAADTYIGRVKYTMVHPYSSTDENKPPTTLAQSDCPANSVCYAPNSYDTEGIMVSTQNAPTLASVSSNAQAGKQTQTKNDSSTSTENISSSSTIQLIPPNYSRVGYGLAGWSTDFDAEATYKAGGNPIVFGPNETITKGSGSTYDVDVSSKGLILYPVWIKSTGTIQNWNTGGTNCNALTTAPTGTRATLSSMTALTDARDGNTYTVARLADGKCWMTENLRLNNTNSDNSIGALAQGYGSYSGSGTNYGNFIGLAESENANFNTTVPSSANNATNSIYSSDGSTAINIKSSNNPAYRIPRYNSNNTNRSLISDYNSSNTANYYHWYGYGNYYNWPAAIANTNYFGTNNTPVTNTSLCPTGWRLPQGGDKTRIESNNDNDFWTLIVTHLNGGTNPASYSSSTTPRYYGTTEGTPISKLVRKFPNNFVYSGYWSSTRPDSRNSLGYYWTSTANGNYNSYTLYFSYNHVYPGSYNYNKNYGASTRCIVGT